MNKKILVILIVLLFCIVGLNHVLVDNSTGINLDPDWGDVKTNTAICVSTGIQGAQKAVSDGQGGAIIVWQDKRSGVDFDIYSQRINAKGVVQWTVNGLAICTASGDQTKPKLVSDGQGGAIITWQDRRSGTEWDVYAQWINTNGDAYWPDNGTAICTVTNHQENPELIRNGQGDIIFTWQDKRGGSDFDVYAQKINATGDAQWTNVGEPICTVTGDQRDPRLVTDGQNGAIIAWRDKRGAAYDIYAQHINVTGAVKWMNDGEAICTSANVQERHRLLSDGLGGAFIVWQDARIGLSNYNIYMQKINSGGNTLWQDNGTGICTAFQNQKSPRLVSDGQGGVIVTWDDSREYSVLEEDIYAHRVNANGNKLWPLENGTKICNATGSQSLPSIASDNQNGAIIAWQDRRNVIDEDIYVQHINSNGITLMEEDGKLVCNVSEGQYEPQIIYDNDGSIILIWDDSRDISGSDIYAQRLGMYLTSYSPPSSIAEDTQYLYDFNTNDDTNATWILFSNTTWLNLNPTTGVLSGTPNNTNVGWFWVNVTVEDNTGSTDWYEFTVTVFNVNDAPNITTIDVNTTTEDELYIVTYHAEDIDPTGDTLTWSFTSDAEWLDFNTSTGNLSGIPTNDDVGVYWVNITVSDGQDIDWTNFSLEVLNVNDGPELITDALPNATEDEFYNFVIEALDVDGPTMDWTILTNANWLIANETLGKINGTPTNDDVSGDFWVDVTINDGILSDNKNLSLIVINVNDPPVITTEDEKTAYVNESYNVDYDAIDDDIIHGDILTWSLTTNAGTWLALNSSTGILKGKPTNQSIGEYIVNVSVNDGEGGIDFHNFTLTVEESSGPNQNPIITTIDVVSATVNVTYSVDYAATDDRTPLDQLTWHFSTNATWLNYNLTTKTLRGIPELSDVGKHWVNISVTDGDGGLDFHNFTITVYSTENEPPVITTEDVTTAKVNKTYSVDYEATDDRTPINYLQWVLKTNASWLSIDKNTGVLSGKPMENDIGTYWVNVSVTDGEQGWAFHNFTLTVISGGLPDQDDHAPVLTQGSMSPSSGDEDTQFTFTVHYEDEDGDPPESIFVVIDGVEYEMELKPGDNETNGDYIYVTKLPEGNHTYYFKASDGTNDAVPDDDTPTTPDTAVTTPDIQKGEKDDDREADNSWMLWLAIIIIIIIVLAILAFAMMRHKPAEGPPPEEDEGEEDLEEWEDEESEEDEDEDEWEDVDEDEEAADEDMDDEDEAEDEDEDLDDETEDEAEEDWDEEEDEEDWDEE